MRASAWVAAPLIWPAATFSPPPSKGEGVRRGVRLAFHRLAAGVGMTVAFVSSLPLHRMRGEGWGEGLRASALAAAPLIRPTATFSPPPRKGEGARRGIRLAFHRLAAGVGMTVAFVASLSLPRMRGEGWGEGLRASAWVAAPLIRPAATFSPPPRKGDGARRGVRLAFQRLPFDFGFRSHSPLPIPYSPFS